MITANELIRTHWADVAAELWRSLRRRGMAADEASEVVQEVAYRALARDVVFDGVDGLRRWAFVVARNEMAQQARQRARVEPHPDPDSGATRDTADIVESRLATQAVTAAFVQLSASDQAVLREAATGEAAARPGRDRRAAVRLNVQRHRARQRLRALCQGVLGLLVWQWRRVVRPAGQAITAAAPAALAVAVLWSAAVAAPTADPSEGRSGAAPRPSLLSVPLAPAVPTPTETVRGHAVQMAAAVGTAAKPATAVGPAAAPSVTPTLPSFAVPVTGVGGSGSISTRPRTADDPLVCADTLVAGVRCADPQLPHVGL